MAFNPKSAYAEKLRDPRWQKKRLEILNRDNFTCQFCGDKETTLHVHHIQYIPKTDPWDYQNHFLITLCAPCHEYEKDRPEQNEILVAAFAFAGTSTLDLNSLSVDLACLSFDGRRVEAKKLIHDFSRAVTTLVCNRPVGGVEFLGEANV